MENNSKSSFVYGACEGGNLVFDYLWSQSVESFEVFSENFPIISAMAARKFGTEELRFTMTYEDLIAVDNKDKQLGWWDCIENDWVDSRA